MKPVIGMLLILVGLTTGYLVLTNKLPNSGTSVPPLPGNVTLPNPPPIPGHGGPNRGFPASRMYHL